MFIIFEGFDGTGKTTLANKMSLMFQSSGSTTIVVRFPNNPIVRCLCKSPDTSLSNKDRQYLFLSDFLSTMVELSSLKDKVDIFLFDRYSPISALLYSPDIYSQLLPICRDVMNIASDLFDNPIHYVCMLTGKPHRDRMNNDYYESKINTNININKILMDLMRDIKATVDIIDVNKIRDNSEK